MHLFSYKIGKILGFVCFSVLTGILLVGCGGGGSSGGFTGGADTLRVEILVDGSLSPELPANTIGAFPDDANAFTANVVVRVFDEENKLFAGGTVAIDIDTGLDSGSLLYTTLGPASDEEAEVDAAGNIIPAFFRRVVFENSTGIENALLQSSRRTGVIVLVATIVDPASNSTASARIEVPVVDDTRPVSSLTFTGPFVDAVRAGAVAFAGTGTFTRSIAVIANDANGQPVTPDTQIDFFLIDAPITGFPADGPGSFIIAGNDGNPSEGGVSFSAAGGNFIGQGVRRFDRLVLDGENVFPPDNRDLTGIRTVNAVLSNTQLNVSEPFNANGVGNNGASVPYIIGRAQNATILLRGFTDFLGVATSLLTYPAQRLGQTAILVACTTDKSVCTTLNTCDENGANCSSVYLPVAGLALTASTADVDGNTSENVELCVRGADGAGVQGATIDYDIRGNLGNATVTVNGDAATSGSIISGANGCAIVTITSTGIVPNSEIIVEFMTDGVDMPVPVAITPPGSLNLTGTVDCIIPAEMGDAACGNPLACTANLLVVDDIGAAVPGVTVTAEFSNIINIMFNPAFTNSGGNVAGMTDDNGQNVSTFSVLGIDTTIQVTDNTQTPPVTMDVTTTTYTGSITYDLIGGASSTFDFDVNGLTCQQP